MVPACVFLLCTIWLMLQFVCCCCTPGVLCSTACTRLVLQFTGFKLILSTNFLVTHNCFRMQSANLECARCLKLKSDRDAAGKDRMAAKAMQEGHLIAGDSNML